MAAGFTAREISQQLNARVDAYAHELLPGAVKDGNYWIAGSADGEKGKSLKLHRSGPNRGLWKDFFPKTGMASGDLLTLAAYVKFNNDLGKAIAWAKSELGIDGLDPDRIQQHKRVLAREHQAARLAESRERERKHKAAFALWRYGEPIIGTPALAYLEGRGIDFAKLGKVPGALRYRPDVWCRARRGKYPAMLAAIIGADGRHCATHRTFLDITRWDHARRRGVITKAPIPEPKVTLGYYQGGLIPLWKGASGQSIRKVPPGTAIHISEGIEDGLTVAFANPDLWVGAAVCLDNMGGLLLPAQAGPMVIICQNDPIDAKAVDQLEKSIARQQYAGRKVQTLFPPAGFKDFNDWLCDKRIAA